MVGFFPPPKPEVHHTAEAGAIRWWIGIPTMTRIQSWLGFSGIPLCIVNRLVIYNIMYILYIYYIILYLYYILYYICFIIILIYIYIYIISFGPESYLAPQKYCHRGIDSSGSSEFSWSHQVSVNGNSCSFLKQHLLLLRQRETPGPWTM